MTKATGFIFLLRIPCRCPPAKICIRSQGLHTLSEADWGSGLSQEAGRGVHAPPCWRPHSLSHPWAQRRRRGRACPCDPLCLRPCRGQAGPGVVQAGKARRAGWGPPESGGTGHGLWDRRGGGSRPAGHICSELAFRLRIRLPRAFQGHLLLPHQALIKRGRAGSPCLLALREEHVALWASLLRQVLWGGGKGSHSGLFLALLLSLL